MSEQNQQKTQEVTLREEKNNAITSLQDLVRTLDARFNQLEKSLQSKLLRIQIRIRGDLASFLIWLIFDMTKLRALRRELTR